MAPEPNASRLTECVAGLFTLERRLTDLFERRGGEVQGHSGAAAAIARYRTVSVHHGDVLSAYLQQLGRPAGQVEAQSPAAPTGGAGDRACAGAISRALRDAYVAMNGAVLEYSVLHETAHILDSVRFSATVQIAERHLRRYAAAAQEITQLLATVVAWELRQEGHDCNCRCPACSLGICWCVAHTTDTINAAWRDTAPPYPSAGLRVMPNSRRPPDLDVRDGDLVIAVDGQRVANTADVTMVVLSHARGEPIRFSVERRPEGAVEIIATRR